MNLPTTRIASTQHYYAPSFDSRQTWAPNTKQMMECGREQAACWPCLAVCGISKAALHLSEELFLQLESPALVGDRVNREMANVSTLQHHLQSIKLTAEDHDIQNSTFQTPTFLTKHTPWKGCQERDKAVLGPEVCLC